MAALRRSRKINVPENRKHLFNMAKAGTADLKPITVAVECLHGTELLEDAKAMLQVGDIPAKLKKLRHGQSLSFDFKPANIPANVEKNPIQFKATIEGIEDDEIEVSPSIASIKQKNKMIETNGRLEFLPRDYIDYTVSCNGTGKGVLRITHLKKRSNSPLKGTTIVRVRPPTEAGWQELRCPVICARAARIKEKPFNIERPQKPARRNPR